jgi:hypothetical protein
MNINATNLKVGMAASKDITRRNLMSIHVTPDYTEATNGHIVARVGLPFQFPCEDIPSACPTQDSVHLRPFIMPADTAMKMKPCKVKNLPCLDGQFYVDVEGTNLNGKARFTSFDLDNLQAPELVKIDMDYPDIDRVIPSGDPEFRQGFNIEYLETLLAIAKSTGAKSVVLNYYGHCKPLVMETHELGTNTFKGAIMPIRL